MSPVLIALIGLVYGYISIENLYYNKPAVAIIFLGYAIGNIGLYLVSK